MAFKLFAVCLLSLAFVGGCVVLLRSGGFYAVGCSCGNWATVHKTRAAAEASFASRLSVPGHDKHTLYMVRGYLVRSCSMTED